MSLPPGIDDLQSIFKKIRIFVKFIRVAFIVEQAGGRASDGFTPILDIEPTDDHQTTPLVIGSEEDVKIAEDFIQNKRED